MAVIPPWLNVSPSDFLRAMQSGAESGLRVAALRQQGQLETNRLNQIAAEAEARREEAASSRAAALDFQRWEQEQRIRQQAAALAQQAQSQAASLDQRRMEMLLRNRFEMAKAKTAEDREQGQLELGRDRLEAQKEHWKATEDAQSEKIKQQLGLPAKTKINVVGRHVVAINPEDQSVNVLWSSPEAEAGVKLSGVAVNPNDPKLGRASGLLSDPFMQQRLGTNAVTGPVAAPAPPAAPKSEATKYFFNPSTGRIEPKE